MSPETFWSHPPERPIVALLLGATAVGKTTVSLQLAERLNAEIVSVDSRLFYRGMDIATAKPSVQDRSRIPHHLIDIAEPGDTLSLATFQQLAHEAIAAIVSRYRLPLLVGGTGQYVRAVTAAWIPPRVPPNAALRLQLECMTSQRGGQWLHKMLNMVDPVAADFIDARNTRRCIRALEVILTTGRRFSEQRRHGDSLYRVIAIGLRCPRADLYARIDTRIDAMFNQGVLEETKCLLEQGYGEDVPAMSAIGYLQCLKVLHGVINLEQAKAEMRRATRALVRRQANWFKESDPHIMWFESGQAGVVDAIESFIRQAASVCATPTEQYDR
jgi:tRNA dimethylallyltransferase